MGALCTSSTQSQTQLPEWLTGPASGAIQSAVTESQKPFVPYTGELTAGINPTQQQGIDVARGSQGNWAGQFGQAQGLLGAAVDAPGALASGQRYVDTGATMSSVDAASPLIAAGTGAGGLATASPFLSAASQTAPSALAAYMSPYTSSVVDEIGRLGSRNLTENILPNINDTFIGSGQFGSDRNAMTIGRAIRDTSADIAGKQASALEAGYGTAGQLFESDAARQAALAGTAGGLGESAASRALTGANLTGSLTNADANRWLTAGTDVAGMASADQQAALAASRQAAALSGQQQQQNLTDANALLAAGGVQQTTQNAADQAALAQFMRGQNFNWSQLGNLNSIIRGTPYPSTTTQSAQTSPYSAALGLGALGLSFFRDGGPVRGPAKDYSPLTAFGRMKLARGGYIDDEEGPDDDPSPVDEAEDGPLLADASPLVAMPRGPIPSAAPSPALAALREKALARISDDSDLKAAQAKVDEAQAAALAPRVRDKSWMDSPLAQFGLSVLAAPPGTSALAAVGQGGLSALRQRQAERRLDQADESARRTEALKAAQQRLSNVLNMRTTDTRTLGTLATIEGMGQRASESAAARVQAAKDAAQARIDAAREAGASREQIAQMMADSRRDVATILSGSRENVAGMTNAARERIADGRLVPKEVRLADALGFNLQTEEGRNQFADFSTKAKSSKTFAPLQIEKAQKVVDDPNADPDLREAAKRLIASAGNRDLTPAQLSNLRARASTLANADLERTLKDFQFNSPEDMTAYRDRLTEFHRQQLLDGATGETPPPPANAKPIGAPAAIATPAPGAPTAAPIPAPAAAPAQTPPPSPTLRPRLGPGEEKDLRGIVGTAEPLLSDLDAVIARLENEKGPNWLTGIGGLSQRAYNATAGQFVGNASPEDTDYFSRVNGLKPRLQQLIKVDSNMSKDEKKDLDAFLDNQGIWQSRDTALSNFKEARRIVSQRRQTAAERLGARASQPADGSAAPSTSSAPKTGARPSNVPADWTRGTYKGKAGWFSPDRKKMIPIE